MLPTLYSDRSQFMVTFPNMIKIWQEEHEGAEVHYVENDTHGDTYSDTRDDTHGTQNGTRGTQNGTQGGLRGEDLDEWIAYKLAVHPKMTTEELASLSGKSSITIKRHIAGMQRLKFVGSGANGYWVVGPKVENPKSKKDNQASEQVSEQAGGQASGQASEQVRNIVRCIGNSILTMADIQKKLKLVSRRYILTDILVPAINQGYVMRAYPDSPRHPKQRYYLSEKGLKLAEKVKSL